MSQDMLENATVIRLRICCKMMGSFAENCSNKAMVIMVVLYFIIPTVILVMVKKIVKIIIMIVEIVIIMMIIVSINNNKETSGDIIKDNDDRSIYNNIDNYNSNNDKEIKTITMNTISKNEKID